MRPFQYHSVVESRMDEKEGLEKGRQYVDRMRKRYWILSFLYHHRKESPFNLHAVTKALEETMHLSLRDQDIRCLIEELISRGLVIKTTPINSNSIHNMYQLSENGVDWWEKHGNALIKIM